MLIGINANQTLDAGVIKLNYQPHHQQVTLKSDDWRLNLSKIGVKPENKVVGKGLIRLQKLVDELKNEINSLKARVKTLENA